MTETDPSNHFSADEDWKSEAEAERARLAEADAKSAAASEQPAIPEATFDYFVIALASQAMMALAMRPDPSGQVYIDLNAVDLKMAEHHIDLLAVLDEKTKGNLTDEESKMLTETVDDSVPSTSQIKPRVQEHWPSTAEGSPRCSIWTATPGDESSLWWIRAHHPRPHIRCSEPFLTEVLAKSIHVHH